MTENTQVLIVCVQNVERLVQRVRTRVGKVTAVKVQTALPVPAASVAVELNADVHNSAQNAGGDDFLDLEEIVCKTALLEHQKMTAVLFCRLAEIVKLLDGGNAGLFAKHVQTVSEQILGDRVVQMAGRCIDNQINVVSRKQLGVIIIDVTAVFLRGAVLSFFELFNNRYDAETLGIFFQVQTVNVSAASALSDDRNAKLFHNTEFLSAISF